MNLGINGFKNQWIWEPNPYGGIRYIIWLGVFMMHLRPIQQRKAMRLKGYDYNQAGAYFVTICCQNRECLFGKIIDGQLILNDYGVIVEQVWNNLADHFYGIVEIDQAVVMPNHFHGIVVINRNEASSSIAQHSAEGKPAFFQCKTQLGKTIAYFKYQTTKLINQRRNTAGTKIWQRNYYDHIIRNEASLKIIQQYVLDNPVRWKNDQLHPSHSQ